MKALLIAEKPSLMREIQSVYKKRGHKDQITFKSFVGHTMTLLNPKEYTEDWSKWDIEKLPMIPEEFKFKATDDKIDIYKDLKKEINSGKYDYIINACDPAREGQLIFFSFYDSIGCKLPVKRLWHKDLTENELKRALDNLLDESSDDLSNMTEASKYRSYFDWLVGLNSTRAVSIKSGGLVNLGRVMTPTLNMIVERELEIINFKSKPFWQVNAEFDTFTGVRVDTNGQTQIFDKSEASTVKDKINGKEGVIEKRLDKKNTKKAPQLFSLQTLSSEANKAFGYTMAETLRIAQELYEQKLISYPRTDSPYITTAITKDFNSIISSLATYREDNINEFADRVLGDTSNIASVSKDKMYVNDKKVTDHYAIIPTGYMSGVGSLKGSTKNLYKLICKRFLSIFLGDFITNESKIEINVEGEQVVAKGSSLVSRGFTEIYNYEKKDSLLPPELKEGSKVKVVQSTIQEGKTKPKPRYNDNTLGKAMENAGTQVDDKELSSVLKEVKGLGTPATRGAIVEKLVALNMIKREKKNFHATDFGISIIKALEGEDLIKPELTGKWEKKLMDIESGELKSEDFNLQMNAFVENLIRNLKEADKLNIDLKDSTAYKKQQKSKAPKEPLGKCPKCSKNVVEGKTYYLCEGYKESCDFIFGKVMWKTKITKTEAKKLLTKGETKEMTFTWNSGKQSSTSLIILDGKVAPSFAKK